jgi:hypothetical protein
MTQKLQYSFTKIFHKPYTNTKNTIPKKSLKAQPNRRVPCTVAGIIHRPIHHMEANTQVLKIKAMECFFNGIIFVLYLVKIS